MNQAATVSAIPSLADLLNEDLDYICGNLREEFAQLAGKSLLITGGAGFLGYYLIQSVLHYNRKHAANNPVRVTVWDSFIRGRPQWLTELESDSNLKVQAVDMIEPLPSPMPDFQW